MKAALGTLVEAGLGTVWRSAKVSELSHERDPDTRGRAESRAMDRIMRSAM